MRFSTAFIALLSVGLAPATGRSLFASEPATLGDKVPGQSPLELCDGEHKDDILTITSVDLVPNPPKAGESLEIKASGVVKQRIEKGAYVQLQVKYGLIRLISTKADLCEQIKNVDLECPIEKGIIQLSKSVDLPNEIPPGKYTVTGDVYTVDDKKITCLTAQVTFSRDSIATPLGDL